MKHSPHSNEYEDYGLSICCHIIWYMAPILKKIVTSIFRVKIRDIYSYPPLQSTASQKTTIFTLPQTARKDYILSLQGFWSDFFDVFQIITFLQYVHLICTLTKCQMQWAPHKDVGWPTSHDARPHNIPDAFPCKGGCSQQMCPLKHPSQTQICGH